MANAEDVDIASQQNDVESKPVDANRHETGKDLANDKMSIKSPTCERFSIRGYVARIRTLDRNTCWPFPQHLLQTRLEEAGNLALPPLEIPGYRWWNCESCLGDIISSSERTIEKDYMRDSHASMQAYDDNPDRGCPMLPTSNVDIQEKRKENITDCTEIVKSFTVDLKSGDAVGSSADETDKEKKDEVVTDRMREPQRIESIVPMKLENDKSEIADLEEKKNGTPHCFSNSKNSEEIININDSDDNVECAEMLQPAVETMGNFLVTKTKDELGLKQNKSEERQIPCQALNSWEYFSRNKNVFKEISEKMKEKEVEQATSPILGSENSIDANKLTHISNVPVRITYAASAEPGEQVVVEEKNEKIISKGLESLRGRTMDLSIQNVDGSYRSSDARNDVPCLNGNQNVDGSHRSSDARNDVPCLNGNHSSCSEHTNINKITELKECTENVEPGQKVFFEGKAEKIISKGIEPLTGPTMEFTFQSVDGSRRSSDARNEVPCFNGNDSSFSEHMNVNKITELKECTELSTSELQLVEENVLFPEKTWKLKVSESRSKRKPQRKRLIADIIASKPYHPESWNKGTEVSKSADEVEENMCMIGNNKKSPQKKEDHVKATTDAVKKSSKPTIDTSYEKSEVNIDAEKNNVIIEKQRSDAVKKSSNPTIDTSYGISEVNIDAEKNNVIIKKQRPEKLQVRKKQPGIGIESLDVFSTFDSKNYSNSSLSEAIINALQMPQGASLSVSASRDKSTQHNFLGPEYGKIGQRPSKMGNEIPMDIVELMARNQHEQGPSRLKHFHENHGLQKDRRRLKMNQVNKHVEGGIGLKQNTATAKSKAQPKQTSKANMQASLRNHCQSDLLVDYDQIDVSQRVRDNSFISDKEGATSNSCKGDLSMLQSTRCSNPWGKYSPNLVAPVLDETIYVRNLRFPIDHTKSHVSVTHCDEYGSFSSNKMVSDSMQLQGVSSYCGHMKMQNICRETAPSLSEFTGSGVPVFQNKSISSLNCNGCSHQNLTRTDNPQKLTSQSSDLGNSGKTFGILSEIHKGNGIPNLSVRMDGGSGPIYLNGKSNSAFLQHVNAQARQPSGKKHDLPSASVLRLMGQSVSVPANCGNEGSIATENGDNRNFSSLPQASSQKHVNWLHSSGVMERSQTETFSGTERVFTVSEPIQDSMCVNGNNMNSIKYIPPVPKFRPSGHYMSNGHSGIFTPSSGIPGDADVALESSNLRTKSPFRGTLLSVKKLKKGLQCPNGSDGNGKKFSTAPPACQSTKIVKGSSSTKGLRSYRTTPMAMHLNRNHRSAPDIYLENRHHCFQSPWVLGSNPQQNLTKEAEDAKSHKLNKEHDESAFCGKNACNVEICTLNRNPAEIIIDGEEDGYSFGYNSFTLSHRDLAHSKRKRNMTISQGQKRRRTLTKKHMQEFLCQKDSYVGDTAKTNLNNLDSLVQDLGYVKELVRNIT